MLAKMFGVRPACPTTSKTAPTIDTTKLDEGLTRLRETAAEVSKAAADAAVQLKEEHRRTKACFVALNSASDSIVILDKHGCIFFCNDQFLKTHGIADYKDVVGLHILAVIPTIADFDRVWASCQNNNTEVIKCPTSNVRLTIVPMMNGAPKPIYYACTFKAAQT